MVWLAFIIAMMVYSYQVHLAYSPDLHGRWYYYPAAILTSVAITAIWSWTAKVVQPDRLIMNVAVWDLVMISLTLVYPFAFKDAALPPMALVGIVLMVAGCLFVNLSGVKS